MTPEEMKAGVKSCKDCVDGTGFCGVNERIFNLPKYGTGCRSAPAVMLVGRNPHKMVPRNGMWSMHYKTHSTAQAVLARKLVESLGLERREVYATAAVKCPTHFNNVPSRILTAQCNRHLRDEIRVVNPRIIIALGPTACDAVGMATLHPMVTDPNYRVFRFPGYGDTRGATCTAYSNIVASPHSLFDREPLEADSLVSPDCEGDEEWSRINNMFYSESWLAKYKNGEVDTPMPPNAMKYVNANSWISSITSAYKWLDALIREER